jgi:hypothetical protein
MGRRLPPKLNAWVDRNVAKRERSKFKGLLLNVRHLGDVNIRKAARQIGVSKELLGHWMNTPEISKRVILSLNYGRTCRAKLFVAWAKLVAKSGHSTLKAPFASNGDIPPDAIDYGDTLSLAKYAAMVFQHSEMFKGVIDVALTFHELGGISSAKRFFVNLGKCLSHGTRGNRGIDPELWNKIDVDIADIILSHDPPMSDHDAVQELQSRGHSLRGHPPQLEVRFRRRKHRLLLDAWPVALSMMA